MLCNILRPDGSLWNTGMLLCKNSETVEKFEEFLWSFYPRKNFVKFLPEESYFKSIVANTDGYKRICALCSITGSFNWSMYLLLCLLDHRFWWFSSSVSITWTKNTLALFFRVQTCVKSATKVYSWKVAVWCGFIAVARATKWGGTSQKWGGSKICI